jgi:hypothetical protein
VPTRASFRRNTFQRAAAFLHRAVSVGRRIALVLVLKLAQFAPADVLISFGRIGILVILQPVAEPVHRTTLRHHPHGRIGQNVFVGVQHGQVHRLLYITKSGIRLPHSKLTVPSATTSKDVVILNTYQTKREHACRGPID